LALVREQGAPAGYILVEAKSYPAEMLGRGCKAVPESLTQIRASLERMQVAIGADPNADWAGPYYQYANRLAHGHFLRQLTGRPVWLVNLCFVNDQTTIPTSKHTWIVELDRIPQKLGLNSRPRWVLDVLMPAAGTLWTLELV
jgi:hypothetical protein